MEFGIVYKIFDSAIEAALWIFFFYVSIWNWMDGIMETLALCFSKPYVSDILQAYLFSVMITVIDIMLNLPFSFYQTFIIDEKYGLNKVSPGVFVCDQIKKFLSILVIYAAVIPLVLYIIAISGPIVVLSLAAISIMLIITIYIMVPTVFIPYFYTYVDLQNDKLRAAIIRETQKTGVLIKEIKVI